MQCFVYPSFSELNTIHVADTAPFWRYAVGPTSGRLPAIPYYTLKSAVAIFDKLRSELPSIGIILYRRRWRYGIEPLFRYKPNSNNQEIDCMRTQNIVAGIAVLMPYYVIPEGFHTGAKYDQLYMFATDLPLKPEDVEKMIKLGWRQEHTKYYDTDFALKHYEPVSPWIAYF